jgi:hemolysin type calcium-binding protein/WD40 repeat protein
MSSVGRWFAAVVVVGAIALIPLGSAGASATTAKRIAYVGTGGTLWTIGANGSGTTDLGVTANNPSSSSDGQLILFDAGGNVNSIPASGGAASVRCAGTDPAISPDGKRVAYVSGGHVVIHQLDCGSASPTDFDFGPGSSPAWSPDGTQIVFVDAGGDIAVAPATGGAPQKLGATTAAESDPSWSPDGSQIAYVSGGELYVMNADGSNRQQLTTTPNAESSPSWAPGGDEIVYAAANQLIAITPNGSSTRLLPNAAGASEPNWGLAVANTAPPQVTAGGPFADGTELSVDNPGSWISVSAISSYAYRWQRCSSSGTGCFNIAGAVGSKYTLSADDIGSKVRVVVTATTADGSAPGVSTLTTVVTGSAPRNIVPPTVTGNPVVGETLTAGNGTWSGTNPVFTYQWQKCDANGTAASCANIAGATAGVYVPANGDVGSTVRVLVTATNSLGSATKESNPTAVIASTKPVNTTLPAIAATLNPDGSVSSFSATTGQWTGAPTITYAYQWRRCDSAGANCVDIPAAISSLYFPVATDIGSRLRVVVTATNTYGTATATSDATNVLAGTAPANTFRPSISGTPASGSVLFASNGTWTGSTPLTFSYEWRRCNSGGGSCSTIGGEISQSYIVQAADVGGTIVVAVTAKNAAGSATVVSAPTGVVQGGTPSATRPSSITSPSFSGTLAKGKTLTANHGTWSGTTPMTFLYEWQRCPATGSACTSIPSAIRSTYTLTTTDVGKRMRLVITASNSAGSSLAFSPISSKVAAKAVKGKSIKGTKKNDRLNGGAGPDTIHGGAGNDQISGGAGDDKLYGDAGNDTITGGAGKDTISGGSGNDTIQARDGETDTIDCGSGKDTAVVDATDIVKGCETVRR